ncbi:MAG: methionine--tRNA ligase [Candidatus Baldrarchaeia archaeon]
MVIPIFKKNEHITVTSALPYINGVKHLGNLVGSLLPADVFHRFLDLFGVPNIYICGTDDHGTAGEISAQQENMNIKDYCSKYYKIQKDIYKKWNFDFTFFGRTSSETNHETTTGIFLSLYKNGYIIKNLITIPYCKNCKRFLPDRYVTGTCPNCGYKNAKGDQCEKCGKVLDPSDLINPECAICLKSDIVFRKEKHLFMDFSKLQNELKAWLLKNRQWPDAVRNSALGWIKEGLKPRCITRNLGWGVHVPLNKYKNLVFYCWFDAPIGYISITKDAEKKGKIKNWKKWWLKNEEQTDERSSSIDARVYHFLGKDNVPFHTIFWPGVLIGSQTKNNSSFTLPYYIAGYEFLNWEEKKFSTSQGIGLFSDEALDLFPADYWRFYLIRILPETKDSNFDWGDFQNKINNELIANYGNLFYRTTYFIEKKFSGKVPSVRIGEQEKKLLKKLEATIEKIEDNIERVKLREALDNILAFASETNKYFQDRKPWDKECGKKEIATTLYTTVNVLRIISNLLYPFIPKSSLKALKALNSELGKWDDIKKFTLEPGHKIKARILFEKIDNKKLEEARKYKTN